MKENGSQAPNLIGLTLEALLAKLKITLCTIPRGQSCNVCLTPVAFRMTNGGCRGCVHKLMTLPTISNWNNARTDPRKGFGLG